MNYEQKFQAMQALLIFAGNASLHMRNSGDWYVLLRGLYIKDGGVLRSVGESGIDPEYAINKTWDKISELSPKQYLVVYAGNDDNKRRAVRWNGFMWKDVDEAEV